MKYYFLKLGPSNSYAEAWLSPTSPTWGKPSACIYLPSEEYRAACFSGGDKKVFKWIQCGDTAAARAESIFVVIARGRLWFLQPLGPATNAAPIELRPGQASYPLVMPIDIVADKRAADVPAVLASLGCNQHHVQSTFTSIGHGGACKALDVVLGQPQTGSHWAQGQGAQQLLECLSSVGLETLIAKIFEAHGCFVPAFVGGTMAHVDLFAHNDTTTTISIGNFSLLPGDRAAIQVKQRNKAKELPPGLNLLAALDANPLIPGFIGATEILDAARQREVWPWLRRSLDWLPVSFRAEFGM